MLKKTISYTDFNGTPVQEDFYFNMTRAELIELEFSMEGGFSDTMMRMIETDPSGKVNGKTIMDEMKKLILKSYGVKSADGKRFIKNDQLREDFESSEAYSTLFMEVVTDADAAATFINGLMPADLVEEAAKLEAGPVSTPVQQPMGGVRPPEEQVTEVQTITRSELLDMGQDEFQRAQAALASGTLRLAE